jgi:hypothetical protein
VQKGPSFPSPRAKRHTNQMMDRQPRQTQDKAATPQKPQWQPVTR